MGYWVATGWISFELLGGTLGYWVGYWVDAWGLLGELFGYLVGYWVGSGWLMGLLFWSLSGLPGGSWMAIGLILKGACWSLGGVLDLFVFDCHGGTFVYIYHIICYVFCSVSASPSHILLSLSAMSSALDDLLNISSRRGRRRINNINPPPLQRLNLAESLSPQKTRSMICMEARACKKALAGSRVFFNY